MTGEPVEHVDAELLPAPWAPNNGRHPPGETGRPTKRTEHAVRTIELALSQGNTRTDACAAAGVSLRSFDEWMVSFPAFRDVVEKAEARAAIAHVQTVARAAAKGNWQASAWWLERRRYQEWGRVDRVEVSIRQRAAVLAKELGIPEDDIIAEAERLARSAATVEGTVAPPPSSGQHTDRGR